MNTIPTPETDAEDLRWHPTTDDSYLAMHRLAQNIERRLALAVEALKAICPPDVEPDSPDEWIAQNALAQIEKMKHE